jgi:hypothetical protein
MVAAILSALHLRRPKWMVSEDGRGFAGVPLGAD